MLSQSVMTYPINCPKTALPFAFTEHGVAMLSNVLKSKKARQTSVAIVRVFIALKQFAIDYKEITKQIKQIENKYNKQFKDIHQALNYLLEKDKEGTDQRQRKRIGYK